MSCSHVKSCVNLPRAANQEPASLLTQLLTMTTTHIFPSLVGNGLKVWVVGPLADAARLFFPSFGRRRRG